MGRRGTRRGVCRGSNPSLREEAQKLLTALAERQILADGVLGENMAGEDDKGWDTCPVEGGGEISLVFFFGSVWLMMRWMPPLGMLPLEMLSVVMELVKAGEWGAVVVGGSCLSGAVGRCCGGGLCYS